MSDAAVNDLVGQRHRGAEICDAVLRAAVPLAANESQADVLRRYCTVIVDEALALPPRAVFCLLDFADRHRIAGDDGRQAILRVVQALDLQLRVLDPEFFHPEVGVLPSPVVSSLIRGGEPVMYRGVELTRHNVCVHWLRALPLAVVRRAHYFAEALSDYPVQ